MSYRGIGGGGYPYKKTEADKKFAMNAVPPPSSLSNSSRNRSGSSNLNSKANNSIPSSGPLTSKHGYSTMDAITQFANSSQYAVGSKRKAHTEDEYFDDDDEAAAAPTPELAYIPAPGSPSAKRNTNIQNTNNSDDGDDDEEDDPLDAFMAGIEQQVEKEKKIASHFDLQTTTGIVTGNKQTNKGVRGDIDDEDDEESYYRYMEENPNAGVVDETSDQEIDYDQDGNPIAPPRKREIDPLPDIDHSEIQYEPFEKNFYSPHEDILNLSRNKADDLRKTLGIKVTGPVPPHPVSSFGHFGFDEALMKQIRKSEYTQPTPIQSQAIPAALGGRDLIGIAKTGSGKTAAFIWPMLVHIMDQRELKEGDGPIALILAPTRELSLQIYNEAKKFGKAYNIHVVCCYGGGSKWEQSKALEEGAEIVVATPGRMIDMVKMKATNLRRVTYLVLDEADRMFNMGFEPQVRSICNHIRPDRQTLLFSATFKKRIEKLARDVLTDPIRIVQGDLGEANEDITQHVLLFNKVEHKWNWLLCKIVEFLSQGTILIFVTKKADAEQVANNLRLKEFECVLLHGDMDQADRNKVITCFKRKESDIMVATDVAARGLDIPHIRTVVNYDIARDIDTHTHRIGRTGRAGEKGTAYTLVIEKDKEFVGHLVRNLEGANQDVPDALMELALKSSWFRNSRFKDGKGKKINIGGAGLGYRERPGFGSGGGGGGTVSGSSSSGGGNPFRQNDGDKKSSNKCGSGGPATDRYSAMKEAFKSQYMSQFKASSDRTWEQTVPEAGVFAAPPPPPPSGLSVGKSNSLDNKDKKKRSRWN